MTLPRRQIKIISYTLRLCTTPSLDRILNRSPLLKIIYLRENKIRLIKIVKYFHNNNKTVKRK
jgi:hypothetical protein